MPAPERILLVGGGGREHALAWKLAAEPGIEALLAVPGNDAIARLPGVTVDGRVRAADPDAVVAVARAFGPDLVVIGPEAPLAAGVGDALRVAGFAVFGPGSAAARIESSKAFCREVAAAAGIPIARGAAFAALREARAFAAELAAAGNGVVVKADGLAAGKGVAVCSTLDEAEAALAAIFANGGDANGGDANVVDAAGAPRVVVEERLEGPEASIIALCDGTAALALPAARDHKRLRDGDAGPNTGGMGACSPLPDLPDAIAAAALERFHLPALRVLAARGTPFRGALYAGLMLTPTRGPVLLEFNARFGDPEAQAILPRLAVPLGPLLLAAAEGRLRGAAAEGLSAAADLRGSAAEGLGATSGQPIDALVPAFPEAAVAIVQATRDYPERPRSGDAIQGLDEDGASPAGPGLVFHAGTRRTADGGWETDGGRVLAAVGMGAGLAEARAAATRLAEGITFEGAQWRRDIATGTLAEAAR